MINSKKMNNIWKVTLKELKIQNKNQKQKEK